MESILKAIEELTENLSKSNGKLLKADNQLAYNLVCVKNKCNFLIKQQSEMPKTETSDKVISNLKEMLSSVQNALDIFLTFGQYTEAMSTESSEILEKLLDASRKHPWATLYKEGITGSPVGAHMLTGFLEGSFLKMLVKMMSARRILEIGMFTGYGTLSMAEGTEDGARVIALEIEPYLKDFAQPFFDMSPHGNKIEVMLGDAEDSLKKIHSQGEPPFDFVFIDADKPSYSKYVRMLLDLELIRVGGIITLDNVLFRGHISTHLCNGANLLASDWGDNCSRSLHKMNLELMEDSRVTQVMLPMQDGITLAMRIK